EALQLPQKAVLAKSNTRPATTTNRTKSSTSNNNTGENPTAKHSNHKQVNSNRKSSLPRLPRPSDSSDMDDIFGSFVQPGMPGDIALHKELVYEMEALLSTDHNKGVFNTSPGSNMDHMQIETSSFEAHTHSATSSRSRAAAEKLELLAILARVATRLQLRAMLFCDLERVNDVMDNIPAFPTLWEMQCSTKQHRTPFHMGKDRNHRKKQHIVYFT
ncbi:unnamed protein product, partial [Amoebophrya sp. A25]